MPCEQTYTELGDEPQAHQFWGGPDHQKRVERRRVVRRRPREHDSDIEPPALALEDGDAASVEGDVDVEELFGRDSDADSGVDSVVGGDGHGPLAGESEEDDDPFADIWAIFADPGAEAAGEGELGAGAAGAGLAGDSDSGGIADLEDEARGADTGLVGGDSASAAAPIPDGPGADALVEPSGAAPEPAGMVAPVPVISELLDGQIIRADLDVGRVTAYRTTCVMVAECNLPGHGKCHLTRKMLGGPRPGQGRPLGLLLAWLHDPSTHFDSRAGQAWGRPSFEERMACRIAFAAAPGADAVLACEREPNPDEGDEPLYIA